MTTGSANDKRLEAIVLAAGSGSRFGGAKLLAPWRGGVLLDGALAAAFAAPARTVSVVTGAEAERVEAAARGFATHKDQAARLRIVHAADHAEGMGASLRAAARSLPQDAAGVFVFLGDMPRIPTTVPHALAASLVAADAAAPFVDGRRGHPVLIGASLFPAMMDLGGDEGARALLSGLGERLARVDTDDDGVLFDVDRPQDLPA